MTNLAIIGIDSLDPNIILKYRKKLPTFSKFINESQTFFSKSVFPVDTIPCWASIYTGMNPSNHGLLYVYDIFDPKLSDLKKLDIKSIPGKTFWDYTSNADLKSTILFPTLMYPPWEINGIMISKSPFDVKIDNLKTERDILTYPAKIKSENHIPCKMEDLWGGFPGEKNLNQWSQLGKDIIQKEAQIGIKFFKKHDWDLFFIYFSILDIIQHRLWRFFDKEDPTYPGKNHLENIILDYYILFDNIISKFSEVHPEVPLLIVSDHGHKMRPIKKVNINEYLRKSGFVITKNNLIKTNKIKDMLLKTITKLNMEHHIIKLVSINPKMTQISKSAYSSADNIENNLSLASLSSFAGIKSYSYGGIDLNKELISEKEYEEFRSKIIDVLHKLNAENNASLFNWILKREELYPGIYTKNIFPDIIFDLKDDYCVGWDLNTELFGKSYDHKVASGGHGKDAVFLLKNVDMEVEKLSPSILDICPTILDLFQIDYSNYNFDGQSIFKLE